MSATITQYNNNQKAVYKISTGRNMHFTWNVSKLQYFSIKFSKISWGHVSRPLWFQHALHAGRCVQPKRLAPPPMRLVP